MSEQGNFREQAMVADRSLRLALKVRQWHPTQAQWTYAAQSVQVEEKDRIGKFMFKRDAKSAMVGRLLMRFALSKIFGMSSSKFQFGRTEKGKPYLINPPNKSSSGCHFNFNVSHQGDYVVLAAEKGSLVGVDVMKVEWPRNTPVSSFFKTMHRQFSDREWSAVKRHCDEMSQLKVFYRLWCLKESVVKAYGTGIGFEVSRLNFSFETQDIPEGQVVSGTKVEIDGEPAPEWTFEESFLDGHCMAVAVNNSSKKNPCLSETSSSKASPFQILDIQQVLSAVEPLTGSTPDLQYWENFNIKEEQPSLN